jgi:hypothetical protein
MVEFENGLTYYLKKKDASLKMRLFLMIKYL